MEKKYYDIHFYMKDGCVLNRVIDLTDEEFNKFIQDLQYLERADSFFINSNQEVLIVNPSEIRNITIKRV